ncbi:DUF3805 domain-containing protein [Chryseobacterium bernardetii]|uniref:DUF3805 domain-containing protein n=1 Tax=Chryseobacterium bernardetii TaxID=1241978 RepID=UPI0016253C48|nr:DUF3805 domain-containing protein [Chryseobacterium bernardetii]
MININSINYNQFISNQGWVSFNYPANLISIEEEEGTYLFYTEKTGSFRLTPLKLEGKNNFDANKYLKDLSNKNKGKILKNQHGNEYVYYISSSADNEDNFTIFNWIFAVNNKIVYCSYTIDTDSTNDSQIISEKGEIFKIIENLNITKK